MSSTALVIGLPSLESTRPHTHTSSPLSDAPWRRSAPLPYSLAPCAKNGPSTIASVSPGGALWGCKGGGAYGVRRPAAHHGEDGAVAAVRRRPHRERSAGG